MVSLRVIVHLDSRQCVVHYRGYRVLYSAREYLESARSWALHGVDDAVRYGDASWWYVDLVLRSWFVSALFLNF